MATPPARPPAVPSSLPDRPSTPRTIAFAVPRYGADVLGGAEALCRAVAENLADSGHRAEVFTTCAVDHFTWADHHPPGTEEVNGVLVHRFRVDPDRDHDLFFELHHRIALEGSVSYVDELRWMAANVRSRPLAAALSERDDLDAIFAMPYLFGTTHAAVATRPDKTILVPCLHDEPHARTRVVRDMLTAARGCLVNTPGEARLVAELAPDAALAVGGVGFEDPGDPPDPGAFCAGRGIDPGYLIYAGRREEGKGLADLFDHYAHLRRDREDVPPLALMGTGDLRPPPDIAAHVIDLGFVAEEEKAAAFAGAALLLHPSRLESFGLVLMEAWLAGTPAVVNGDSVVLRDHVHEAAGGLWYRGYAEFAEAVGALLDDDELRCRLAEHGRAYVRTRYSWEAVRGRCLDAVDTWG